MDSLTAFPLPRARPQGRLLVLADWTVDPHGVVSALSRHSRQSSVALLVPAWLHGLDWVGDPTAAVPCAQRHLGELVRLCGMAGIPVDMARVGDPDPVTSTVDALEARPASRILLCTRSRHFAVPPVLGLSRRLARATGVPVARVSVAGRKNRCAAAAKRVAHDTLFQGDTT
jgi:hypothetical protein